MRYLCARMSWKLCSRAASYSRISDDLFHQMRTIDSLLSKYHIQHSLMYGSLLGAVVYRDINPREVDNDFVVPHNFTGYIETLGLERKFNELNLTLFRDNIYRVCRTRTNDSPTYDYAPWNGDYIPYSDLYPTNFHPYYEPTFGRVHEFWSTRRIRVRHHNIMAPNRIFTMRLLHMKYGHHFASANNRVNEKDNLWKAHVHKKYRRATTAGQFDNESRAQLHKLT